MAKMEFDCECCGRKWEFGRSKKGPLYCRQCIEHLRKLGVGPEQRKKTTSSIESQQWYTIEESGNYLRISSRLVYQLLQEGQLTAYRVGSGGHRRFKQEDLDAVMSREDEPDTSVLTAQDDPVLAALWDNEKDAAYDNL